MFWNTEEKRKKDFDKNLEELKIQKNWLERNFEHYGLFDSLLLNESIYVIQRFELPEFTDKNNHKLKMIIKNRYCKEDEISVLYYNFIYESRLKDFLINIINHREKFKNLRKELNIFGFQITDL